MTSAGMLACRSWNACCRDCSSEKKGSACRNSGRRSDSVGADMEAEKTAMRKIEIFMVKMKVLNCLVSRQERPSGVLYSEASGAQVILSALSEDIKICQLSYGFCQEWIVINVHSTSTRIIIFNTKISISPPCLRYHVNFKIKYATLLMSLFIQYIKIDKNE